MAQCRLRWRGRSRFGLARGGCSAVSGGPQTLARRGQLRSLGKALRLSSSNARRPGVLRAKPGGDAPGATGSWARPERRSGGAGRPEKTAVGHQPGWSEEGCSEAKGRAAPRDRGPSRQHLAPPPRGELAEDPRARNNAGTAALLFGLLGLVFMALFPPIGLLLAVAAIVCGLVGRARGLRGVATNRGQVLAGLLCGGVGLAVSGAFVITEAVYVANHPALLHNISSCAAKAHTSKASTACVQRLTKAIQGAG